ncbi:MAG: hypothetical protein A2177_02430 [Spirochaetes bacterium RBG_13_68_11]|nr:MAG: hypothetical protein A2177_02430 [Spirochaetes bacterium RBG_13_68_11]
MNWHDAMLGVMRGEPASGLLFVPRLDIWYNANRKRGTLPGEFRSLDLPEVSEQLGVGLHSVVPDFARTGDDRNLHHRALGFYNHPDFPYRADFSAVEYRVVVEPQTLSTIYRTSTGDVSTRIRYGPEFLDSGSSIPDILEPAIKGPDDYPRVAEILSKARIVPAPEGCERYRSRIGERGVAVAYLSLAASPMHHIMRDLRKLEPFFFDLADDPRPVHALADVLAGLHDALVSAALESLAEVFLLGANYDDAITYPPFFERYIMPWLRRAAERLHGAGKLLMTHTDGENQRLLPLFLQSRFDIADSVCPAPMTKVPLRDYRKAFGRAITIWGGIPSIMVLENSCSEADFRSYVDALIEETRPYNNFILSVADTLPPDADFERILYLRDRVAEERTL